MDLSTYLQSFGFEDIDYWLSEFEKLGVQGSESILHLEEKTAFSYAAKLLIKARNKAEKVAIKKVFRIADQIKDDNENSTNHTANEIQTSKCTTDCQTEKVAKMYHCDDVKIQKIETSNPLLLKDILMTPVCSARNISPKPSFKDNQEVYALFEKLGLSYNKKLQLRNGLCIKLQPLILSLHESNPATLRELANLVLQKLMAYDSLCRSYLMSVVEENDCLSSGDESDSDSVHVIPLSRSTNQPNCGDEIHPVDCLMALLICSDDILRQDLFSRLAKCQLAVPFIIPDPFSKELTLPLWALRSIIKEWDCIKEKGEIETNAHPIISYAMPIITFIRLGKYQKQVRSKSAILNEVISDSLHYDHFFHRDCEGGSYKPILAEGLVDMCWYLPGITSNVFEGAVTFLNLHGDAREHPCQTQYLSQISSMCFILLTEDDMQLDADTTKSLVSFSSSTGSITLLTSIKNIPNFLKKKGLISLDNKNMHEIKRSIRGRIKKKLAFSEQFKSIEEYCTNQNGAIIIDEYGELHRQGITESKAIVEMFSVELKSARNTRNLKDVLLPLQGDSLWKAWASNDKELQRQIQRGSKSINEYTEDIKQKKAAIRQKQLEHVDSLPSVVEAFLVALLSFEGPSNCTVRTYFIQFLKLQLDNLSRKSVSKLQHQYHAARNELSKLQSEKRSTQEIGEVRKQLENLQQDIVNSSFGLEHLLRELGQVYEAALESDLYQHCDSLQRLPKAAAELLIDGYPLELMDGDAAHVPLQWVTAVLKEAAEMLGDPKVFVLSVLGLQSTGKSTMLNTVFGLKFNVSSGRCTCGAFMQLLPLDDELKTKTKCDYLLVVDTEGLRAPQLNHLETQKHDNELATFVIGLANMTLINIYGEVSGDMDDILQTSVHAFLRMTQIKFSPSCQFVHHNAGINLSSEVGRANITKKLNQFTVDAAKHEHCEEKFKCFNDVIKFNDQTDVHYFPGLWMGDPPMAPINLGYSKAAQKLKLHLVESLCKQSTLQEKVGNLHLSAFQIKLQDIWKALLKENFIFSFRNTQEIIAYNSLETEYNKWDWEFREPTMTWERVAENEIDAADVNSTSALVKKKEKELQVYILTLYEPIKTKMKQFFSGKQSEILVQWKAKFERKLENRLEELKIHAEKHCKKLAENREAISKFEQNQKQYAAEITEKIQKRIFAEREEQKQIGESLKDEELRSDQLEKIHQRNVFTSKNLKDFRKKGIITESQMDNIQEVIAECNDQLNLPNIIFPKILNLEQMKRILLSERLSEDELEARFEDIWIHITKHLPCSEAVNIEKEVETSLIEFVQTQGYESQLITKLQEEKRSLRKWGDRLTLRPIENIHYTKVNSSYHIVGAFHSILMPSGEKLNSTSDPHLIEVITVTEEVLNKACFLCNEIAARKTDFNPGFTLELLRGVDEVITMKIDMIKDKVTFTHEYRLTIFLMVCGYAIPHFEKVARLFKERTDPKIYLEKHLKKPLFIKFKNQFNQTEDTYTIANTLCTLLEVPIKDQIKKTLGTKIVSELKGCRKYFSSKKALKIKILTDLHGEDTFEYYMVYVKNVKECLQNRLKQYTMEYADEDASNSETRLQFACKEEVNRFISIAERTVREINEADIQEWIKVFCTDLASELGSINTENLLTGFDISHEINPDNFKQLIYDGLQNVKKSLQEFYKKLDSKTNIKGWKDQPHDLLSDVIGCTEQCPFCGEQCDLLDPNHFTEHEQQHRTAVHRPSCLEGWRTSRQKIMSINFCTSLVSDLSATFQNQKTRQLPHYYREYYSVYPEWSIPHDSASKDSLYWKWFVGKYSNQLAEFYWAKPANVPKTWCNIKWPQVVESLKKAYNIKL